MHKSLLIITLLVSTFSFAQTTKEERDEKRALSKMKVEYNVFRRQILTLPEYSNERHKVAELQKTSKVVIKVSAWVDSTNEADDAKTLTGFIREAAGENGVDVYEVTYDRAAKKITTVKPTGETLELEDGETKTKRKTTGSTTKAKSKDEDDDSEDDEPKKNKSKSKSKDEDDE